MAKKVGGTKVGNLLRKAVSTVKKVGSAIVSGVKSGAAKAGSQSASAGNYGNQIKKATSGTTPKIPSVSTINKTVSDATSKISGSSKSSYTSTGSFKSGGMSKPLTSSSKSSTQNMTLASSVPSYVAYKSSGGGGSSSNMTLASSVPEYQTYLNGLITTLGTNDAPTSADGIGGGTGTSYSGGLPDKKVTIGGSTDFNSYLAGDKAQVTAAEQEKERRLAAIQEQEKQDKSFLDEIFKNTKGQDEIRRQLEDEYGVDFQEMMQKRKGIQAELDVISQEYANVEQMMNQQIAQESSRFGLQDFTNNRIAQIKENAAPQLNALAAKGNLKSAQLAALNEDWETSEKYIRQAVEDTVAEQKDKIEQAMEYRESKKEMFDSTEQVYRDAWDEWVATMKDKLDFDRQKYLIKYREEVGGGSGGVGVTSGFANYDIETGFRDIASDLKAQVRAGSITLEEAYQQLRDAYSPSEVSDQAIMNYLGVGGGSAIVEETPKQKRQRERAERKSSRGNVSLFSSPAPTNMAGEAFGSANNDTINQIANYLFNNA